MRPTLSLTAAALLFTAAASAQTYGTSHPETLNDDITTTEPLAVRVAPTAAPVLVASDVAPRTATVVPRESTPKLLSRPVIDPADQGIVTTYRDTDNSLGEGTQLRIRLQDTISTKHSLKGERFSGTLIKDVRRGGQIIFPVGSTLQGRITEVHGGKRIGGKAALHLEPERLTLPDGTVLRVNAHVIDTDSFRSTHVTAEGTIVRNDGAKGTLAALTLTTGSSAAAGAIFGGVPGALIGAGVGAGIGTAVWLRQDRQETLTEGSELVFALTRPMSLTPITK